MILFLLGVMVGVVLGYGVAKPELFRIVAEYVKALVTRLRGH